jgi:hypothetical protein
MAYMLAVFLFGAAQLHAQQPPAQDLNTLAVTPLPLEPGPLLNPAPDQSQWTITSVTVSLASKPANAPVVPTPKSTSSTFTKDGKIYQVVSIDQNGGKTVRWSDKRMLAAYLPGLNKSIIIHDEGSIYYIDFSKSDYPDFFWISHKNYVGVAQVGGGKALVFKGKVRLPTLTAPSIPSLSQDHGESAEVIGLVDLVTRRPLLLQADSEQLSYQFSKTSPNLTLPPDVANSFAFWTKSLKESFGMPKD